MINSNYIKMKIALLNLPFDSNFGGNLQRYALITILKREGYDIEHINLRINYQLPFYKIPFSYTKRLLKKLFLKDKRPILLEQYYRKKSLERNKKAESFYQKYIPHTLEITRKKDLYKLPHYDAYIVGSDQVWRKAMTKQFGLSTFFFDFIKDNSAIKIAYGASLGSDKNELSLKEIKYLGKLYKHFKAISVRENSAMQLFKEYQWNIPQAVQVLDPTLLLSKEDYINLIKAGKTDTCPGNLFCYILDNNKEKEKKIQEIAKQKNLEPFKIQLNGNSSIEQWLQSFQDAQHIITDSYHGLVFSIIFNKPFTLIKNEKRGNARFDSLFKILDIPTNENIDWTKININIQKEREKAIRFINAALHE